jgi:septal ring factor EnvC (AmiA/AmiB activator)
MPEVTIDTDQVRQKLENRRTNILEDIEKATDQIKTLRATLRKVDSKLAILDTLDKEEEF